MIKIKKILCPVDFLPGSDHAVSYAIRLAAVHHAKVYLLHVVEPIVPSAYADGISIVDITQSLEQAAIRQMNRLVSRLKTRGAKVQGSVVYGAIRDVIERVIADL